MNQAWKPTLSFLRRRKGCVSLAATAKPMAISWSISFEKAALPGLQVALCQVESSEGLKSTGVGLDLWPKTSTVKAFAEAYERLWLEIITQDIVPLPPEAARPKSSSGFAAGRTDHEARIRARGELVERAVMLEAWSSQQGWALRVPASPYRHLLSLIERKGGMAVSVFRASNRRRFNGCMRPWRAPSLWSRF